MAQKKVYFYEAHLYDGDDEIDYSLIRNNVIEIVDAYAKDKEEYKSLDITPFDEIMHVIFDVFDYKNNKLFGRLSKQHPNNTYVSHDYSTYDGNEIFPANANDSGIENYTFAYFDYTLGILAIVSAMGAPGEKALTELFTKFYRNYSIEFIPIPNENAVREIYNGQRSEIARVEIEVPLPNPEVLRNLFGWKEEEIYDALENHSLVTYVVVKSEQRGGRIVKGGKATRTIIDAIISMKDGYKKAKMKAQSETVKLQDFNLFDNKFNYPIDISNYHIVSGERVFYTIYEMVEHYKQNLAEAFNSNSVILKKITGR